MKDIILENDKFYFLFNENKLTGWRWIDIGRWQEDIESFLICGNERFFSKKDFLCVLGKVQLPEIPIEFVIN